MTRMSLTPKEKAYILLKHVVSQEENERETKWEYAFYMKQAHMVYPPYKDPFFEDRNSQKGMRKKQCWFI